MTELDKKININFILEKSYNELKHTNINQIVSDFKPIFIEFYNFIESNSFINENVQKFKSINVKYINILYDFMNFLKETFYLDVENMLVLPDSYTVGDWGPLYWGFLHYSSILLQYINDKDKTSNLHNFHIILFHIENILPCNICSGHFLEFKKTNQYKKYLKSISYGLLINVTYVLHHIITLNIYQNQYKLTESNMPRLFNHIDFMKKYKCYPLLQTDEYKFQNFIIEPIDFQNNLHINLTHLLSAYTNTKYLVVSRILKKIYNKNIYNETINYKNNDMDDIMLINKSEDEIKNMLENLLNRTLTLADDAIYKDDRKNIMEESINYILSKCA